MGSVDRKEFIVAIFRYAQEGSKFTLSCVLELLHVDMAIILPNVRCHLKSTHGIELSHPGRQSVSPATLQHRKKKKFFIAQVLGIFIAAAVRRKVPEARLQH